MLSIHVNGNKEIWISSNLDFIRKGAVTLIATAPLFYAVNV
mgnify:CR=1 FL=1